jgi:hypothetical protein
LAALPSGWKPMNANPDGTAQLWHTKRPARGRDALFSTTKFQAPMIGGKVSDSGLPTRADDHDAHRSGVP